VLHGIEAAIWAAAYLWVGALGSSIDAMLYSIDSMTTRGASGLVVQQHWQMMGALEAVDGMLLFGISTAYIFAVMQLYWPMLFRVLYPPSLDGASNRGCCRRRAPARCYFSSKYSSVPSPSCGVCPGNLSVIGLSKRVYQGFFDVIAATVFMMND